MLTEDELTARLREAYTDPTDIADVVPPDGLVAAVRQRYGAARRRRVIATLAAPVAAAAAIAGVALTNLPGTHAGGTTPAPLAQSGARASTAGGDPGTIRLAGYTFTLPAAFHAEAGSCTVTVRPGGRPIPGTPGADGNCVAIYRTQTQPRITLGGKLTCGTFILESDLESAVKVDPATGVASFGPGRVTAFVSTIPASHGGGFIVVAGSPGWSPSSFWSSIKSMVEQALGPDLRAC